MNAVATAALDVWALRRAVEWFERWLWPVGGLTDMLRV